MLELSDVERLVTGWGLKVLELSDVERLVTEGVLIGFLKVLEISDVERSMTGGGLRGFLKVLEISDAVFGLRECKLVGGSLGGVILALFNHSGIVSIE